MCVYHVHTCMSCDHVCLFSISTRLWSLMSKLEGIATIARVVQIFSQGSLLSLQYWGLLV